MTPSHFHIVDFQPSGKRIAVSNGTSLLEAARQAGIQLSGTCNGQGDCGQCCVRIVEGQVTAMTVEELEHLTHGEQMANLRLACHIRINSPILVDIPHKYLEHPRS